MNGWTEQQLIYEAAFQYEWGYSGELEKAARECIARLKADAWLEGHREGRLYQGDGWNCDAHDPDEDNPYRDN